MLLQLTMIARTVINQLTINSQGVCYITQTDVISNRINFVAWEFSKEQVGEVSPVPALDIDSNVITNSHRRG